MKLNTKLLITLLTIGTMSIPTMAQIDTESIDVGKGGLWDGHIVVPYSDVEDVPFEKLVDIYQQTGISRYNLGFVVADDEGEPVWFEDRYTRDVRHIDLEVASGLKTLRDKGLDGMICFGGPKGTALYEKEDDVDQLAEYYDDIVDMYELTAADFYMKGTSYSNAENDEILTNIDALVELQKEYDELEIWLTFETDSEGIHSDVWDVIEYAMDEDLEFEGINFAVTEYKSEEDKPYEVVEQILEDAHDDLEELMPKLDKDEVWETMGVTCVLDKENPQLFSVEDAKKVANFVDDKEMGYLGYYAVDQDSYDYKYAKAFAETFISHQIPMNLRPVWVNDDEVIFEWDILSDKDEIDHYRVYRQIGNQRRMDYIGKSDTLSYEDDDVEKDTTYTYYVTSINDEGKESAYSQPLKVKTLKEAIEEIDVDAIDEDAITKDSVTLSWDKVKDADYYEIYRNGEKIATTEDTEYTDKGLQPGTIYTYVIRAIDEDDDLIAMSKSITVQTKTSDSIIVDVANFRGEWQPGVQYEINDIVCYKDILYICIQRNFALTDWQPSNVRSLWNRVPGDHDVEALKDKYMNQQEDEDKEDKDKDKEEEDKDKDDKDEILDLDDLLDADGTEWEVGVAYKAGDRVIYEGKVYSCVQPHTAHVPEWNPPNQPSLWGPFDVDPDDVKK